MMTFQLKFIRSSYMISGLALNHVIYLLGAEQFHRILKGCESNFWELIVDILNLKSGSTLILISSKELIDYKLLEGKLSF